MAAYIAFINTYKQNFWSHIMIVGGGEVYKLLIKI